MDAAAATDTTEAAAKIVRLNEHNRMLKQTIRSLQQYEARRRINANKQASQMATAANTQQEQRNKLLQLSQSVRARHQSKHFVHRQREEQAKIIENSSRANLNHVVLQITEENTSDIALLNRVFSKRVDQLIRSAVQSAYLVGIDYVGGVKKRSHEMFITSTDVDQIKALTAEFSEIFWRRVAVVLHQKDTMLQHRSARFSPRSSLTLASLVTSLATKLVTKTIALATIAKVNALKASATPSATGSQQDSNKIAHASNNNNKLNKSAAADGTDPSTVETLQWVTQHDERVCPFCTDLDGTIWTSDDPSIVIPGTDSHENCRCRLDVVGTGQEATGLY
jgi:SPP1 gp7 family putative phage head morphogenesis protein